MSSILVTLTSRSDSDFKRSKKINLMALTNPNSNDIDYYVRKNEEKILYKTVPCTDYDHIDTL